MVQLRAAARASGVSGEPMAELTACSFSLNAMAKSRGPWLTLEPIALAEFRAAARPWRVSVEPMVDLKACWLSLAVMG